MSDRQDDLLESVRVAIDSLDYLLRINCLIEIAVEQLGQVIEPEMRRERAEVLLMVYLSQTHPWENLETELNRIQEKLEN